MTRVVVRALRAMLAVAFTGLLLAQLVVLPWVSGWMAQDLPEVAFLRWPLLAVSVLGLACAQVVVVCTWRLLALVEQGSIFSDRAFPWVDRIVWAVGAAWALVLGVFVYLTLVLELGPPGIPLMLLMLLFRGRSVDDADGGHARTAEAGDDAGDGHGRGDLMAIVVRLDVQLAKRKMSVGELAERVGITPANVAVLKNGRAKAVRFTTLEAMCRVLECQPGDLLAWVGETDHPA